GGGRTKKKAGDSLWRREGRPCPLPRGTRLQVPRAGPSRRLREAGFCEDEYDDGAEAAAVCRGGRRRCGRRRARDRSRTAGGLHATHLATGDDGDSRAAPFRDETGRILKVHRGSANAISSASSPPPTA